MKSDVVRSRLTLGDLANEAVIGLLQRPWRSALTAFGTILGVGTFAAVLGLTSTAEGQIDARFTELVATEVIVQQANSDTPAAEGEVLDSNAFPADADSRVAAINGVRAAGVWWTIPNLVVTTLPYPVLTEAGEVEVRAASPGLIAALRPTIAQGRLYDKFHDKRGEQVVVLGSVAAAQLGISSLALQPAVFIDGIPFTVIGVIDEVQRQVDSLFTAFVPSATAMALWDDRAGQAPSMTIDTELGAAGVVADQVALALRPEAPDWFHVLPPPDPRTLREGVTSDLSTLFLLLAVVSLVIGTFGIGNSTMVAVLERVAEIGLRRALGAQRRHIAAQFLAESAAIGTIGGLAGTSVGVLVVVAVAATQQWTPLIEPWTVFPAPLVGSLIGILAGGYPALRASRVQPVEALRR